MPIPVVLSEAEGPHNGTVVLSEAEGPRNDTVVLSEAEGPRNGTVVLSEAAPAAKPKDLLPQFQRRAATASASSRSSRSVSGQLMHLSVMDLP